MNPYKVEEKFSWLSIKRFYVGAYVMQQAVL